MTAQTSARVWRWVTPAASLLRLLLAMVSLSGVASGQSAQSDDEFFGVRLPAHDDAKDGPGLSPEKLDFSHPYELIIYKNRDCTGKSLKLTDSMPNLREFEPTNHWHDFNGFTLYGLWILHQDTNYGGDLLADAFVGVETPPRCFYQRRNLVFSIQKIGANVTDDTMYVWSKKNYAGDVYIAQYGNGIINLEAGAKSLVLTGKKAYAIYNEPSFKGLACCIYPQDYKFLYPFMAQDTLEHFIPHDWIKSTREGCSQHQINCVYFDAEGNPHGFNKTAIGR